MKPSFKQKIIRGFDRAAQTYDQYAVLQRKVCDRLFALSAIRAEDVVLDGGCGTGYLHELLRKNKIYCPLVQLDMSEKMCRVAAGYSSPPEYGGTETVCGDMEKLPFTDGSFDFVFSSLTLQWAEDIAAALDEARRVLRNNGRLAFSITGEKTLYELKESFAAMDDIPHVNDNFMTEDNLRLILKKCGFKNIRLHSELIIEKHGGIDNLLRSIKGIGAGYKKGSGKYPGRDYFARLEQLYIEKFGDSLPLSWDIIYVTADK